MLPYKITYRNANSALLQPERMVGQNAGTFNGTQTEPFESSK